MSASRGPAEELAGMFADMSGLLLTEATVANALSSITSLVKDTVAGSTGAGVTLLDTDGRRVTSAATDPLVEQLDDLQYQLDEGPCLSAWQERSVFRSDGNGDDDRWPTWAERARELGMRAFISAPLVFGDDAIGAIKVYSTAADTFGVRDAELLRRFAEQAAIFVGNIQTVRTAGHLSDQLKETLRSRDLIATARGIVMGRQGVGAEEAFRTLAAESQRTKRPLREVASRIVTSPGEER